LNTRHERLHDDHDVSDGHDEILLMNVVFVVSRRVVVVISCDL